MDIRLVPLVAVMLTLISCSDGAQQPPQDTVQNTPPQHAYAKPAPIADREVSGSMQSSSFYIDQAILRDNTLTLRRGHDFFADASVEIRFRDESSLAGKKFNWTSGYSADKPGIKLGRKANTNDLPKTVYLDDDYEMKLEFGARESLGIPVSIRLKSSKDGTDIEGRAFATFGDLRVKNKVLNTHYDSFDLIDHLAREYIHAKYDSVTLDNKFGISFVSYTDTYPKTGFVGYEATSSKPDKRCKSGVLLSGR